jgi:hypothetical protein
MKTPSHLLITTMIAAGLSFSAVSIANTAVSKPTITIAQHKAANGVSQQCDKAKSPAKNTAHKTKHKALKAHKVHKAKNKAHKSLNK